MNILIVSGVMYPFVAEWFIFMNKTIDNNIYWLSAFSVLLAATIKKLSVLKEVVTKVNRNPEEIDDLEQKDENPEKEESKFIALLQNLTGITAKP